MSESDRWADDKEFRAKWFHGKDLDLLEQGKFGQIDLGVISEHDIPARVRQAYLLECDGEYEKAQAIYDSAGVKRIADPGDEDDEEPPNLDEQVEHYGG